MTHRSNAPSKGLRVCHVVNAVGETTGPANHAVALQRHTSVDAGILGWFRADPTDEMECLDIHCVQAPDTALGIDRTTAKETASILSRYDVVHTHHPHSATFAKLITRRLDIPTVFTYGTPSFRYTLKGRTANGLTNRLTDCVTCVSPAVRDALTRWERWSIDDAGVEIVYTGVDIDSMRAASELAWSVRDLQMVPETGRLVGHAGRLVETKAQDVLIEGIAEVNDQINEDAYLIIAGDGPRRTELEEIATEESIEDHVIFTGLLSRQKAYKLMADVDVFAMPSKWEGFSSSTAEAMSIGTPCLLSDIQAFREPFDGVARFHPVGDSHVLADKLAELLTDEGLRHRFGDAARQRIEDRFTIKRTAEEYARIYREIV